MPGKNVWKYLTVMIMLVVCGETLVHAQLFGRRRSRVQPPVNGADTTVIAPLPDSVIAYRDSVHRADSVARQDSLNMLRKSSLERERFHHH